MSAALCEQEAIALHVKEQLKVTGKVMEKSDFTTADGSVDAEKIDAIKAINFVAGPWRAYACRTRGVRMCATFSGMHMGAALLRVCGVRMHF
jgi:hypothetical protein